MDTDCSTAGCLPQPLSVRVCVSPLSVSLYRLWIDLPLRKNRKSHLCEFQHILLSSFPSEINHPRILCPPSTHGPKHSCLAYHITPLAKTETFQNVFSDFPQIVQHVRKMPGWAHLLGGEPHPSSIFRRVRVPTGTGIIAFPPRALLYSSLFSLVERETTR